MHLPAPEEVVIAIASRASWHDIVQPAPHPEQLRGLAATARRQREVHATRGSASAERSPRGLHALFVGSPGTGKMLAARVLATELGLTLLQVGPAARVSKCIGKTEKNLERALSSAARLDAALLLNETDALFGRRSELRDATRMIATRTCGSISSCRASSKARD